MLNKVGENERRIIYLSVLAVIILARAAIVNIVYFYGRRKGREGVNKVGRT